MDVLHEYGLLLTDLQYRVITYDCTQRQTYDRRHKITNDGIMPLKRIHSCSMTYNKVAQRICFDCNERAEQRKTIQGQKQELSATSYKELMHFSNIEYSCINNEVLCANSPAGILIILGE